jgi:hypothetical protein
MSASATEWARCRPWIEAALPYAKGTHTIEDIEAGVAKGEYTLWPGDRSAAITEIHQFPRARFLHVFLAGGDLAELRDEMVPMWRIYAKLKGCSRLTLCGRRGWERALKSQGWRSDLVCLDLPTAPETN